MSSQDPVPPKAIRFTIPRSLRAAFVAEPRIILDQSGIGVLLFSKQFLADSKAMKALLEDAEFFENYELVAIPKSTLG